MMRERLSAGRETARVVVRAGTDEHAAGGAARAEIVAGALERLPARLQQQALLRVHALRLARRDAEQLAIEALDAVEHAGALQRGRPSEARRSRRSGYGPS
nr:hypothetical protein [Burkholderia gladioli]